MTPAVLVIPLLCQPSLGPHQEECRRWPCRDDALPVVRFIDSQIAVTSAHLAIWPHRWEELTRRISRLNLIRQAWDAIDDLAYAVAEDLDDDECRERLERLRLLIGDEDFYARRLPLILP